MTTTKDIYFAAFLVDSNYQIIKFKKEGHIIAFSFDIDESKYYILKSKYLKSEFSKVNMKINELKRLGE